jgi:hypothetical protein
MAEERLHLLSHILVFHHHVTEVGPLVLISKTKELVYWLNCVNDIFQSIPPLDIGKLDLHKYAIFGIRPFAI